MKTTNSIYLTKQGFENSFLEAGYYNKQTADDSHMALLLNMVLPQEKETVLDLGTGNGYLAFPLAKRYAAVKVIGLDIVDETLKRNKKKALELKLNNLDFATYDGISLPFKDSSIDIIISRYALHHFPDLKYSMKEMGRVLRSGGKIIISDPTPNQEDHCCFVDKYMQIKPDGHIRFYYLHEYQELMKQAGFQFISNEMTEIKFPRKEVERYSELLTATEDSILAGYDIQIMDEEIWITEKVLNMIFVKV